MIPPEDAETIRAKARFDLAEIEEIEKRTNHDVIAFLENVASYVGPAARWMHQGLTSSDVLDTTLAVQMARGSDLAAEDLAELREVVARRAHEFKTVADDRAQPRHPCGADHLRAEAGADVGRIWPRRRAARGSCSRASAWANSAAPSARTRISIRAWRSASASGSGCRPAALSTQVIQRDRHAEFQTALALIASSIDRWATEFRHLQRTEVLEVEEYFSAGQKGSSAMPHKRNPITGEKLTGLARVVRGNAMAALENVPLWHERDISHSSVERIIMPDSCILVDYMLVHAAQARRPAARLSGEHGAQSAPHQRALLFARASCSSSRAAAWSARRPTKPCSAPR